MTVQLTLNTRGHEMEYILAIEGIGWLVDEADISQGFAGSVFVVDDLNGDLASILGCTVRKGLAKPTGVSDSFSVRTNIYSPGSTRFTVQDQDDFLVTAIKPHTILGTQGTLGADLEWSDTSVITDEQWTAGQTIWLAGREAIKLGTESGSGPYTYANSTRGYLGTPRGRQDTRPTLLSGFAWEEDTRIDDYCRWWYGRRCILFMHVPGEAIGNIVRCYTGVIKSITAEDQGNAFSFASAQDITTNVREMRFAPKASSMQSNSFLEPDGRGFKQFAGSYTKAPNGNVWIGHSNVENTPSTINPENALSVRRTMNLKPSTITWYDRLAVAMAYNYRNLVPGGTKGMRDAAVNTPRTPQAYQDYKDRYRIDSYMLVGESNYVRALHKREQGNASDDYSLYDVVTEVSAFDLGTNNLDLYDVGQNVEARFLLDNYSPFDTENRFIVDRRVTRNPVNVLLMFLTSMNNEFKILNTSGVSTTTSIEFAASSFNVNEWVGYALFRTDDSSDAGRARVIQSNDTDTVVVDRAFDSIPGSGTQHQIRNTIYDVLPLGYGLGIHNTRIDLDAFEQIRDKYLADAELGKFAMGAEPELNVWDLLVDNICIPYGILLFRDKATGKLTARYIGAVVADDGIIDDYVTVGASNVLNLGDPDYTPRTAATRAILKVRDSKNVAIKPNVTMESREFLRGTSERIQVNKIDGYVEQNIHNASLQSKGVEIPFIIGEKELTVEESKYDEMSFSAMFDTEQSMHDALVGRIAGLLRRESNPPPQLPIKLDMSFMLTVQVATILNITIADPEGWNPLNPLTGDFGWTNVIARVIGTTLDFSSSEPGIGCQIELLDAITSGRIAPAADVDSKGSDGSGAYFVVHDSGAADYSEDVDLLDWRGLRVGDYIELRNQSGAVKENSSTSFGVIKGFGSNLEATPEEANNPRIYITSSIASTIAAGDYLTFESWSTNNTSNMDNYAAYADTNKTLGSGNDSARIYE